MADSGPTDAGADRDAAGPGFLTSITIDGVFEDWDGVPVAATDARGDGRPGGVDLGRVWLAHDHRFLFLRFQAAAELDLNEGNELTFFLDTDADAGTGRRVGGIGAEVTWRPGERRGEVHLAGETREVTHRDVLFHAEPTVTASEFEVAFGRAARPAGLGTLFPGPRLRLLIQDGAAGDRVPERGATITYTFEPDRELAEEPIPLSRRSASDLRVVTYNVLFDGPWSPGQEARFGRQLAAVAPDIISFQEIWDHSPEEVRDLVGRWLGYQGHATGQADCVVVSRYPILRAVRVDGNLAVLLDTTEALGRELLLIDAHLPCCDDDEGRQREADRITAFLRDARSGQAEVHLEPGTPIVITGDFNLVGSARPLTTLLTGDIVNEDTFGADHDPDWDDSALTNLVSRQPELRMGYTWRSDLGEFWPGHLDYILYSDAVLDVVHHFVLCTHEMSAETLSTSGLDRTDSQASDHLLFAADFRLSGRE